jgi:membrane protease YdiL (CAAX protease family)
MINHRRRPAGKRNSTTTFRSDRITTSLRGFGPLGTSAILVILAANVFFAPLGAVLVLAWARWSRTPWREIGYAPPKSWIASVGTGVAFGAVFKILLKTIVMPLLGAPAVNQAYHFVIGNTAAFLGLLVAVVIRGGFGEETLFRGYLFERLGKLFGTGGWAKTGMVLLTTGLFAPLHYFDQGLPGVEQATVTGIVFGTIFASTGRIWVPMFAHAAFDVTALALIYWNVESEVAHLIFK